MTDTAPGGAFASRVVPAVFGTLVFAYGGWVFIRGAIGELHARLPGMMTLISLAISVALGDWCRGWESNPHDPCGSRDFKSLAPQNTQVC